MPQSLTVPTTGLVSAVTSAARVAMSTPGVGGLRFAAHDGSAVVEAVGADTAVRLAVGDGVQFEPFVLPAGLLSKLVKSLPSVSTSLRLAGGRVVIESGGCVLELGRMRDVDVAPMPPTDAQGAVVVPAGVLRTAARRTVGSIAKEKEARVMLKGAITEIAGTRLQVVGTDAYRIAMSTARVAQQDGVFSGIVPARAFRELASWDGADDDPVRLGVLDGRMVAELGDATLVARLIASAPPNLSPIVDAPRGMEAVVHAADLVDALRRAGELAQRDQVALSFSPGSVVVSSAADELGSVVETLPCEWSADTPSFVIDFDFKLLLGGLEHVSTERAVLQFAGPHQPAEISSAQDDGYRYVVIPRRRTAA